MHIKGKNTTKIHHMTKKPLLLFISLLLVILAPTACVDEPHEPAPMPIPDPTPPAPADTTDAEDTVGLYSGTLPVLYIITEGQQPIVSKDEYLRAKLWIDALGIKGYKSLGSAKYPLEAQIKGRGNYTWSEAEKKPYRIKLNNKIQMLGMPPDRHWVLLANAFSTKGMIENALPFEISRSMGLAWTPKLEPVEVVLNGDYIGLYFLTEKIRVGGNRVNITEQYDYETDSTRVSGGWLLEINNYNEPSNITFTEGNGKPFWVMPHSPERLSDVQRNYITSLLMSADSAIYCSDKNDDTWERYINIDSLAVYYIVQEIVDNQEAFSGSCYIHKEFGENTKLIFGPIWDCDHSYLRYGNGSYEFNQFLYEDVPSNWYCRWIGEIVKFPHFQERIRVHWKRFYQEVYPYMDAFIDAFVEKIEQAGNADHMRWPQYNGDNTTYRMNKFAKPSFHKKVEWLNGQWGETQNNVP